MPSKKSSTTKKTTAKKAVKKTAKKVAKKATKKTTKKAVKKTTKKSANKNAKVLVCANGKECFWTNDGQVLSDLRELSEALDSMAQEVFNYHVTKEKNDFADWVESVLSDAECASALRRSKKPSSARTIVVRHLKTYTF